MNAQSNPASSHYLSRRFLQYNNGSDEQYASWNESSARDSNSTKASSSVAATPADGNYEKPDNESFGHSSLEKACQSAENYNVYATRSNYVVSYVFELETTSDPLLESRSIQSKMIRYLLQNLMLESSVCDHYRKKGNDRKRSDEILKGLLGIGSPSHPTILGIDCESDSLNCFRIMGSVVLYFDESIPLIGYKIVRGTVLKLIYNSDIELGPHEKLAFRPKDESDMKQQDATGTVSGVATAEPESPSQDREGIEWAGIFSIMMLVIVVTVGLTYFILQKYFVVTRRPTDFYEKNLNDSDEVISIGTTQDLLPCTSNNGEHRETVRVKESSSAETVLDNSFADDEHPSALYDIRLESESKQSVYTYPAMATLGHDRFLDAYDRSRKDYVKIELKVDRPKRKSSHRRYVSDTVDLWTCWLVG